MALTKSGSSPRVVIAREANSLPGVGPRMAAEDAVDAGVLTRRKVEGIWLYATAEELIDHAEREVLEAANALCRSWMLSPMRALAGKIAKDSGTVTMESTRPIIRSHVRLGRLGALPALTAEYDPHLSVFDPEDHDEIFSLIDEAREFLASNGRVSADDLRDPVVPRAFRAWRYTLIAHLEWLGLGSETDGLLRGWA